MFLPSPYVFSICDCNQHLTKQQRWDKLVYKVVSWTDGLGYPIDLGIKDTLIVLNLLGFTTSQSCEGHLDHGCANPWVDFLLVEPKGLAVQNQLYECQDKLYEQLQTLRMKYPET